MQPPAISISHLTVRYGPTTALDDARLEVAEGQVHALLGENGAGKSTIVKVLSGLVRPDSGTVFIFGHSLARFEPRFANELGIRTAFQEISLVKDLTVAQNFLLMEEPLNALGMIRGRALEDSVRAQLEQLGINSINPRTEVRRLDLPSRQKIEIARAISGKPRILMLDEPTASLSKRDVQWLGDVIERLKEFWHHHPIDLPSHAGGARVLFGINDFPQRPNCRRLCDGRSGRWEIIELMIGRSLGGAFPANLIAPRQPPQPHRFSRAKTSQRCTAARCRSRCVPAKCSVWRRLGWHGAARAFYDVVRGQPFYCWRNSSRGTTRTIPLSRGRNSLRDRDASRRSQIRGAVPGSRWARKCKFTLASEVSAGWAYSTASRTENGRRRARRSQSGQTGPLDPSAEFQRRAISKRLPLPNGS